MRSHFLRAGQKALPQPSFVVASGAYTPGTSAALPAHAVGDLIIAWVARGTTSAAAPSLATGFTNIYSAAGAALGSCSVRCGYRIATATDTASGVWTNGNSIVFAIYRNAAVGASAFVRDDYSLVWPTPTLEVSDGSSWVAGFIGLNGAYDSEIYNPVTGMATRATDEGATNSATGAYDTDAGVTTFSGSVGLNVSDPGAALLVVEIKRA